MVLPLPSQPADVFVSRRAALCKLLGGRPALVFAGGLKARNYPDNVYPYRADSHFLYLTGASLANAVLLARDGRWELFVEPEEEGDALWTGPRPDSAEIASRTGVDAVRPLAELSAGLPSGDALCQVATLPSADPSTRACQSKILGRAWPDTRAPEVSDLDDTDLALADGIIDLRLRQDDAALENIRTACAGTVAAFGAGMAVTRPGLREHEVRAAMEHELIARGMEPAYGSIVTVYGETLHNTTYHHQIAAGDLLLADLGGEHLGWASDVTRTWPVSGEFSPTQRALYDVVLQAEEDAIALVAPGVRYRDVHLRASLTIARGLVDERILRGDPEALVERGAHALFFPHGIGHLLGLDVHDMEDLGDRAGYPPGRKRSGQFGLAYLRLDRAKLERFADVRGIRIEDDVLCTTEGADVLTAAVPKKAADVESRAGTG
jgi:Xaa-Pro aminopeptidase